MNVWLLYRNSESGLTDCKLNKNDVIKDLNLDIIFKFMARDDKFIYKTVRSIITSCTTDRLTILYRQEILKDFINNYNDLNEVYELSEKAVMESEKFAQDARALLSSSNTSNVLKSLQLLGILVNNMEKIKKQFDLIEGKFESTGLREFYDRLLNDYNAEFVQIIKSSIKDMDFLTVGGEITFSAGFGQGMKCDNIIVNNLKKKETPHKKPKRIITLLYYKIFRRNTVILNDSKLIQEARDMETAGLTHIMEMYQNFIKELSSFFECLHYQTGFYVGCANLYNRLEQLHIPTTMPLISPNRLKRFHFKGLYDLSLCIYNRSLPVCNDLDTEDKKLFIITGANQGGKSTYLRSIGIAQIMMQSGMFVPAEFYCNRLFDGIFTHFTRKEDASMNSGKLDEELSRMSGIINQITPDSMLLLNETFATTTEREGAKIASDVVNALYEKGTSVLMVTHLYEFTKNMFEKKLPGSKFLSAERLADGIRTFHILEREPERTSYGIDLYDKIILDK